MNESTLVPREDMIDAITYLARNVHKWPDTSPTIIPAGDAVFERGANFYGDKVEIIGVVGIFTKDQWLSRRAELQNKPSWGSVGSDINFISQHDDGQWIGHSERPSEAGECFECDCVVFLFGYGEVLGDWRDTLEKRPEQAEFDPFVSVEDAKITIMQSDGDVKHFGGIIGRSLPLEEDAATAKQPTPKGSGNPILGMVLADLTNRALEGKEKYGEPLLAYNGRNPLWDLYQELLDAAMYIRQAIEEQK